MIWFAQRGPRHNSEVPLPVLIVLHLGLCQTWFISGEALHPDLALLFRRRAAPGAQLINLYGSTEVNTCFYRRRSTVIRRYRFVMLEIMKKYKCCFSACLIYCW